ncbi:hypothetical protein TNCV_4654201 [Trichonephila clavipes]|nr:hypothetical protein TNCV_4654201 [Trichonephila clavipes]
MPVVSRSLEHHADDSTIWLDSTPILRKYTLGVVRGLPPSLPSASQDDLRLDYNLEYHYAAKALYKYKPSCLFLGFEPRPYGSTVRVTNHHTG